MPPAWPESQFVADFNNDGFADYIAPSGFVYLGNGDGTFRQGKQVPGAADALADVNGDGKLDILQVGMGGPLNGVLYVALGNGDGTFQPRLTNFVQPMSGILSADLNGDGKADVVGTEYQQPGTLLVYLSQGEGTFVPGPILTVQGELVALADFNGDGIPDILVNDSNGVTVLLGNGDGTFQSPQFTSLSLSSGLSFVVGDFNNDGKLDFLVDSELFLGDGDGTFQPGLVVGCGVAQAAGDFNGDGNLDFTFTSPGVGTCLGNGDGTFSTNYLYAGNVFNNPQPISVVADFNGDGKPDVGGGGFVLLGNGDGTLQGIPVLPAGNGAVAGTFNNKGNKAQDVVEVVATNPAESISVLLNDGKGNLSQGQNVQLSTGIPGSGSLASGDFNGDGFPDVLYVGTDQNSEWGYALLSGNGEGTFQSPQFLSQNVAGTTFRQYSIVVGDFNNDNKLDFIAGPVGNGQMAVALGNGDGTFSVSYVFDGGGLNNSTTLVAADFNGDGNLDIAATPLGSNNPGTALLLGNGDGTFQPATFPLGDFNIIASADLNKDGKADLVGLSESLGYEVLLGKGDGTFTALPRFSAPCGCLAGIQVADMDGDGNLDLFVDYLSESQTSIVNKYSVYLGKGDGTFSRLTLTNAMLTTGTGPNKLFNVIVDLNGDGKPDVVTNPNPAIVLLNTSLPPSGTITLAPSPGSPTSATISPGGKADFSLLVTPSGFFSTTVGLTCSVAPINSGTPACSVPASVQIVNGAPAKVSVTLTAPSAAAGGIEYGDSPFQWRWLVCAMLGFATIPLCLTRRSRRVIAAIPALVVVLISINGCGGSGSGSGGGSSTTYTATVMATAGNSVAKTTLTVTVK